MQKLKIKTYEKIVPEKEQKEYFAGSYFGKNRQYEIVTRINKEGVKTISYRWL